MNRSKLKGQIQRITRLQKAGELRNSIRNLLHHIEHNGIYDKVNPETFQAMIDNVNKKLAESDQY